MNANQRFLVTLFLGVFGIHRFLDHKYGTAALWLVTGGVLWAGWVWDSVPGPEGRARRAPLRRMR